MGPTANEIRLRRESASPLQQSSDNARLWVLHGALWFALSAYAWGSWVTGPYFVPNVIGREIAPHWYLVAARSLEVISLLVSLYILYRFVFKPRLRTGRMTFEGLFVLGCWMMFIQEPWINWTSVQFLYSTVFINYGSWLTYIPGWSSPNAELTPVGFVWGGAYLWVVAMPAIAGSKFMGWLKQRYPQISVHRQLALTYLTFIAFVMPMESVFLRTELFSYASTVPSLTLFAGEKYQFPLYEILSWSANYLGLACIHHFRSDDGSSFVDRGVDRMRLPGGLKTFARFLAIMGGCQLSMLVTYNLPYQFWALHAGPLLPAYEEYRTAGLCGPKTAYACPDPALPIARRSSPTNRIGTPDSAPRTSKFAPPVTSDQ